MIAEEVLEQYIAMKEEQKRLEEAITNIKNMLIDLGSFATDNYVCAVKTQERRGVKPLAEVVKIFGKELVEEYGLINISQFKSISVSRKDKVIIEAG